MREQYHFWPGEQGMDEWDVDRLIRLTAGLPAVDVPLDSIGEIDSVYWFHGGTTSRRCETWPPTCGPDDLPYREEAGG